LKAIKKNGGNFAVRHGLFLNESIDYNNPGAPTKESLTGSPGWMKI
jgi:hypothetical protein